MALTFTQRIELITETQKRLEDHVARLRKEFESMIQEFPLTNPKNESIVPDMIEEQPNEPAAEPLLTVGSKWALRRYSEFRSNYEDNHVDTITKVDYEHKLVYFNCSHQDNTVCTFLHFAENWEPYTEPEPEPETVEMTPWLAKYTNYIAEAEKFMNGAPWSDANLERGRTFLAMARELREYHEYVLREARRG